MYLLDTNVVSELRKARSGKIDEAVLRWSKTVALPFLSISAISILELESGILLMERRDRVQGKALRQWLCDHVLPAFDGRIVPVDHKVAQHCAGFTVPDPRPLHDALIGATAAVHELTLVTRNVKDFQNMGIELFDPWSFR